MMTVTRRRKVNFINLARGNSILSSDIYIYIHMHTGLNTNMHREDLYMCIMETCHNEGAVSQEGAQSSLGFGALLKGT